MFKEELLVSGQVIDRVAEELKLPVEKVEYVYKTVVKYLRYLTKKTAAMTIQIPHIGLLHLKHTSLYATLGAIRKKLESNPDNEYYKTKLKVFEAKDEALNKHLQERREHGWIRYSHHLRRDKKNISKYNQGFSFKEIIRLQNEEEE